MEPQSSAPKKRSRAPALTLVAVLIPGLLMLLIRDFEVRSLDVRIIGGTLICVGVLVFLWRRLLVRPGRHSVGVIHASFAVAIASVIVIGTTLLVGLNWLDVRESPRQEADGVGVLAPDKAHPKAGRGFAVGLGVEVAECDEPVAVTVVVAGTGEYWKDAASELARGGAFRLGIPSGELEEVRYGVGTTLTATSNPIDEQRVGKVIDRASVETPDDDLTIVSGYVPRWGKRKEPLVVRFNADDWLQQRGKWSCYLTVPALSGSATALAAERVAGRATFTPSFKRGLFVSNEEGLYARYKVAEEITLGTVNVTAEGEVLDEESSPEPTATVQGDPAWTCSSNEAPADHKGPFSSALLERAVTTDCSGTVAVAEDDADGRRDVTLLMMGILIAIGLGLLVELVMHWLRETVMSNPG
jgi:hypothetical protein